jgi:hypothetical protein
VLEARAVKASGKADAPFLRSLEITVEKAALVGSDGTNPIRFQTFAWILPDGTDASLISITDDSGRDIYCHVLEHAFSPATLGPEAAFRFDGASLTNAAGKPFRFTNPATGYFADVWAEDPRLHLLFTTSPAGPGE